MVVTMAINRPVLLVPGYTGGGPKHWMTAWARAEPGWRRMLHPDWDSTSRSEWLRALDESLANFADAPIVIAHSLGCIAVAHYAAQVDAKPIAAAFLVAPADVEQAPDLTMLREFGLPWQRLPFPVSVVVSTNDPYLDVTRGKQLAVEWGAQFQAAGPLGHINADAELGDWPAGRALLEAFLRQAGLG